MAPPVDDPRPWGRVRTILALLSPSSVRREFATRQAVICALTALVVLFYQTPDAALTVYLVFFLNRGDRTSSLIMNLVMVLLMSIIIAMVIGVAMVVIDRPIWRVASIASLSFAFLFLASASKLKPIGAIVALITGYALDLLGTAHAGEIATRALLYAWLFAAIPAGISIVVNFLGAPPPRRLAERALAERLELGAAVLGSPDPKTRARFDARRQEGLGEIAAWLKLAGVEKTSPTADIAALRHAAESTTGILLLIGLIVDDPDIALPPRERGRLALVLKQMAAVLRSGGYPVDVAFEPRDDEADLPTVQAALMADLREALTRFAEPPPAAATPATAKGAGGFFLPDAFTNREHVQYALKTTTAAMLCYGLYTALDWPGIHTCFITCYIVSLSTAGETVEKLTLRILGCLVGAAAGIAAIVFLIPSLTSIGALMAVVFAGAFVAAWVAGGGPRIAYAGFQIAFAFFICIIQGPSPAFDMVTARDRVIGILIGNLVAYLVFVNLWPVSVARRIDPAIQALLRGLSALAVTPSPAGRRARAAGALSAHGAIKRDLGLLHYEPRRLRPSAGWLRNRSQAVEEISVLIGPLLLAADGPEMTGEVTRRLDRLADALSPAAAAHPQPPAAPAGDRGRFWQLVDGPLATLEATIARAAGERIGDHAQA
jgi:multidrug resistance protein MdtO